MKKFFSLIIILFIFIIHPSNSKNIPPGTGQSVPANILILLDRTFSMNWPASTYASGTATMLEPMSAIYDPKNDYYWVAETDNGGIGTWDTSTDPNVNQETPYRSLWQATNRGCKTTSPFGHNGWNQRDPAGKRNQREQDTANLEFYNYFDKRSNASATLKPDNISGDNIVIDASTPVFAPTDEGGIVRIGTGYAEIKQFINRKKVTAKVTTNFANTLAVSNWDIEKYTEYLYTAHLGAGNVENSYGYIKYFNPRVKHKVENPYNSTRDQGCVEMLREWNTRSNHLAIDIQGDIYYALSGGTNGSGDAFLLRRDLSTNPNMMEADYTCALPNPYNGGSRAKIGTGYQLHEAAKFVTAIAADSNNKYFYVANGDYIHSFKIENGCVSINLTQKFENPCGISYGLVTDPDNANILYTTGTYSNKICKIELNQGRFAREIKKVGTADAFATSSADTLYLLEPQSINFDGNKNLIVANRGRMEVVVINKELEFQKVFGLSGVSRLRGAMEAIKAVVNDPGLTEGAHFGLGLWSSSEGATGYNGWNTALDQSRICDLKNCMPVRVSATGASKINNYLQRPITLYRQTHATAFSKMAYQYFNHNDSPDLGLDCQTNYVIVIGDGQWSYHDEAKRTMRNLANNGVKSVMVAYGNGISDDGLANFNDMTSVGGSIYSNAIIASTAQDLKTQLQSIIATITSENLGFTAVAMAGSIDDGNKIYQAQFDYFPTKEWGGSLRKLPVPIPTDGSYDFLAEEQLPQPSNRRIWTSLAGLNDNLNNFHEDQANIINTKLFRLTGNNVKDYHNDSADTNGTGRCGVNGSNVATVINGIDDDAKGLINFIRGKDYFDYDGDCSLEETRDHYLADIYNSQMAIVGPPEGTVSYLNENQEAYFRYHHNYDAFKSNNNNATRKEVLYAGANNGIFHAFDASNLKEIWGFVPPLIASNLPTMINTGLNKTGTGGTVPIFGVDGSPVIHDVYMTKPGANTKGWQTISMVPYGRGGAGFSVLDITNPNRPKHLYSILNDRTSGKVYRSDNTGNIEEYEYKSYQFDITNAQEITTVINNYSTNSSISNVCNGVGNTSCFKGTTINIPNVTEYNSNSEVKIYLNGNDVTSSSSYSLVGGSIFKIAFGSNISFQANPNSNNINSNSIVQISITNIIDTAGLEYNYKNLGQTWSSPRIFLLPNNGAGDADIKDDLYVAVFGGGYGGNIPGVGSSVYVMNLENGKILKEINIEDVNGNGIANSIPATPVVITPDMVMNANYRGALVYINDLEGKITKINLTNMSDSRAQTGTSQIISMYDSNTIFSAESTSENGRYMFHSLEAGIGKDSNNLWLFSGTGNYTNLNDIGLLTDKNKIDNLLIGIKDEYFPNYKNNVASITANTTTIPVTTIDDLDQCKNTSTDTTGANCPTNADRGWYVQIDSIDGAPGSNARTQRKVSAEPTISAGKVYFPIFKPAASDPCGLGLAYICTTDDECGTNNLSLLGANPTSHRTERCLYVGKGVLSKPIIDSGTAYVAISGEADVGVYEDLVVIPAIGYSSDTFRINWREN